MTGLDPQAKADMADNMAEQREIGTGGGVAATQGVSQGYTHGQGHTRSKTVTFTRMYYHFLGPGTDGQGVSIQTNSNNYLCYAYDWGASMLPYNLTRCAVKPKDLLPYMTYCNGYEIKSHSVKLMDLICSRDEIQSDGRIVTTVQPDTIEIFEDKANHFRPQNFVTKNGNLFQTNFGYSHCEPRSIPEGMLERCFLQFPPEHYKACELENTQDLYALMDPYHGILTQSNWSGGELERTYTMNHGIFPTTCFHSINALPCNQKSLKLCNKLLDTVYGIQANMSNQTNRFPIIPPNPLLLRFAPYWTATGKAQRRAQFKAIYQCTITFHYGSKSGTNMLELGQQGKILQGRYDNEYDRATCDINRFGWGYHAEDFVIPMMAYEYEDPITEAVPPLPPQPSTSTGGGKAAEEAMEQQNYTLRDPPKVRDPNQKPVREVTTTAKEPVEGQAPPEYTAEVVKKYGLDEDMMEELRQSFGPEPDDKTDYQLKIEKSKLDDETVLNVFNNS